MEPVPSEVSTCLKYGLPRIAWCQDCEDRRIDCWLCFEDAHMKEPLHWMKIINPRTQAISACDKRIHFLGHDGYPCNPSQANSSPVSINVIHTNGFHVLNCGLCCCPEQEPLDLQLSAIGVFAVQHGKQVWAFSRALMLEFKALYGERNDVLDAVHYVDNLRRRTNWMHWEALACQGKGLRTELIGALFWKTKNQWRLIADP